MSTVTNVSAGKPSTAGSVFRGATSLTLPTNATDSLAAGFEQLGYVSEDGLVNENSIESEDIKAWGGDTVLSLQTEKTDTFTLTLIETLNVNVLKAVYGDTNVSGTLATGITIEANSSELESSAWVFDMILRGGYLKRIVLPNAKVTEIGEVSYTDDEATGYEITITAFPDADGNTHYEYISLPSGN